MLEDAKKGHTVSPTIDEIWASSDCNECLVKDWLSCRDVQKSRELMQNGG